jgi:hypothetical protein
LGENSPHPVTLFVRNQVRLSGGDFLTFLKDGIGRGLIQCISTHIICM